MPDTFPHTGPALELLVPALLRLGAVLAIGLVAIVVIEARRGRRLGDSSLFVRWRTWLVILPVWLAAVVHPVATLLLVVGLSVQAVREYAAMVGLHAGARRLLLLVALTSAPLAAYAFTSWRALPPLLLLAATLPVLVSQDVDEGVGQLSLTTVGMVYLPYLLTFLWLLRAHERGGPGLLLAVGVAVAMSDVGAFVAGSTFGRTPLASRLSPSKTRAGVVGNLIGATLGVAWSTFAVPDVPRWLLALIPLVIAGGALWGDLLESLFKRRFGVKDAGSCLPGFGGLLDRVDSLLVVAPLTYTLVVVVGGLVPGAGG
jgi:phosphatidate cytidylyltransferase